MAKKDTQKKVKKLKDVPMKEIPEVEQDLLDEDSQIQQTMNQQKIYLAQNGFGPVIIEMLRDVAKNVPLIGATEFETVKNAIIIDTTSGLMMDFGQYIEDIKSGSLIGKR